LDNDLTIDANHNMMFVGPLTANATITVPSTATLTIV